MIDWLNHFATGFINGTHHHTTRHDGTRTPSIYNVLTVVFAIGAIIGAIAHGGVKENCWIPGRWLVAVPLVIFWPYVVLVLMAVATLIIPAYIVVSWVKLIPSREVRAAKATKKIEKLRGEIKRVA